MRLSFAGLMLAVVTLSAFTACDARKEKNPVMMTGVVNIGPAGDFPAGAVNTNFLGRYGIVVVNSGGTPFALLPKCTEDGAAVKWTAGKDQFECPNDGSRYDILGRVTRGPAKSPLRGVVPVREPDGTLTVDLSKLYGM